ncbi:MAG TPA: Hsp20/alpha crystallin family protein [Polyangia bacterium]|nr:Hsp20/alpha crystallin family protein [Polyangia bacterium]
MLVRWTPFSDVARLEAEMNRLFNGSAATVEPRARGQWDPAVDVTEDVEKIVVQADLPGVDQQGLDIQIEQQVLTLKGERRLARPDQTAGELYRRYERTAGAFSRQFRLPPTVDPEKISASLKDGVLTLTLPKKAEAQPRQIKVSVQ